MNCNSMVPILLCSIIKRSICNQPFSQQLKKACTKNLPKLTFVTKTKNNRAIMILNIIAGRSIGSITILMFASYSNQDQSYLMNW